MAKLDEYRTTLKRVIDNLEAPIEEHTVVEGRLQVVANVQAALRVAGYDLSLSQAEELWGDYSYNNYASWMCGGESVDEALSAIIDYCHDIEYGENHIGL